MSKNNHEEVCREMLDLFHDAAKENKIPEGLFHTCSNHLMELRKLHDSEKTISYSVPYPCFSVHDGPLADASLRVVGATLHDPHSPRHIKTFVGLLFKPISANNPIQSFRTSRDTKLLRKRIGLTVVIQNF
ncbi:MAG: hypothetical protein EBZ26_07880 [Flavobacteriia bacterium]|nr:hypothetical protein [Flavobacteriia bacterium]